METTNFNKHLDEWIVLHNFAVGNSKIEKDIYIRIKLATKYRMTWTIEGNGFMINPKNREFIPDINNYYRVQLTDDYTDWKFLDKETVRFVYDYAETLKENKIFGL